MADAANARARLSARLGEGGDRMESKPAAYHARLAERFRAIAVRETPALLQPAIYVSASPLVEVPSSSSCSEPGSTMSAWWPDSERKKSITA